MKKKIYMTVTEAVKYLLDKDEQIDAGTIDAITYENGNLTFTFKDGSTQTINIATEPLEVEDIEALTDEQLENLKAGDIVLKLTNGMKHTYIVTYKEDRVGLCLSYFDFGYSETVSYDYDSEVEAWTLNDVERLNIKQELDDIKDDITDLDTNKQDKLTAGSGITIDPETNEISSDGVTYTAGTNINIDENNEISCTVDTSNFVEKLYPVNAGAGNRYRTKIERDTYTAAGYENARGIRNKAYDVYMGSQMKYAETFLGTKDSNDYDSRELIFNKSGTPSYTDATNVAYKILNKHSLTESINNKYKKVYNTSNNSYVETFKYTDSANNVYTLTKEPFKFIAEDTVDLSADVTVEQGCYEVTKLVVKNSSNVIIMESAYYKNLTFGVFGMSDYKCTTMVGLSKFIVIDNGNEITKYEYDETTTPETLVSTRTFAMDEINVNP